MRLLALAVALATFTASCSDVSGEAEPEKAAGPAPVAYGREQTAGRDLGVTRVTARWVTPATVFGETQYALMLDGEIVNATDQPIEQAVFDCVIDTGKTRMGMRTLPAPGVVPAHRSLAVQGLRSGYFGQPTDTVTCGAERFSAVRETGRGIVALPGAVTATNAP